MRLFWELKERLSISRKIYYSHSIDPYFNLAFEEYLFRHSSLDDQILFLWQNDNTVVIGCNQNPWKECNLQELKKTGAKLVRRLSGGGAVYHDLGNLNFTFISNADKNRVRENIGVVTCVLKAFGIEAVFNEKNDIEVGAFKVSGNAYFEENNILCHHGTLLCNTDIDKLTSMLNVSRQKLESKGIESIRSRIKNLSDFNTDITVQGLKAALVEAFWSRNDTLSTTNPVIIQIDDGYRGNEIDMGNVLTLRNRYSSWDWNYGASPEFNVTLSARYSFGEVVLYLMVENGIIKKVKVSTDALDVGLPAKIESRIVLTKYDEKELMSIMLPKICN